MPLDKKGAEEFYNKLEENGQIKKLIGKTKTGGLLHLTMITAGTLSGKKGARPDKQTQNLQKMLLNMQRLGSRLKEMSRENYDAQQQKKLTEDIKDFFSDATRSDIHERLTPQQVLEDYRKTHDSSVVFSDAYRLAGTMMNTLSGINDSLQHERMAEAEREYAGPDGLKDAMQNRIDLMSQKAINFSRKCIEADIMPDYDGFREAEQDLKDRMEGQNRAVDALQENFKRIRDEAVSHYTLPRDKLSGEVTAAEQAQKSAEARKAGLEKLSAGLKRFADNGMVGSPLNALKENDLEKMSIDLQITVLEEQKKREQKKDETRLAEKNELLKKEGLSQKLEKRNGAAATRADFQAAMESVRYFSENDHLFSRDDNLEYQEDYNEYKQKENFLLNTLPSGIKRNAFSEMMQVGAGNPAKLLLDKFGEALEEVGNSLDEDVDRIDDDPDVSEYNEKSEAPSEEEIEKRKDLERNINELKEKREKLPNGQDSTMLDFRISCELIFKDCGVAPSAEQSELMKDPANWEQLCSAVESEKKNAEKEIVRQSNIASEKKAAIQKLDNAISRIEASPSEELLKVGERLKKATEEQKALENRGKTIKALKDDKDRFLKDVTDDLDTQDRLAERGRQLLAGKGGMECIKNGLWNLYTQLVGTDRKKESKQFAALRESMEETIYVFGGGTDRDGNSIDDMQSLGDVGRGCLDRLEKAAKAYTEKIDGQPHLWPFASAAGRLRRDAAGAILEYCKTANEITKSISEDEMTIQSMVSAHTTSAGKPVRLSQEQIDATCDVYIKGVCRQVDNSRIRKVQEQYEKEHTREMQQPRDRELQARQIGGKQF